jgi:sialate O-acetylesterase
MADKQLSDASAPVFCKIITDKGRPSTLAWSIDSMKKLLTVLRAQVGLVWGLLFGLAFPLAAAAGTLQVPGIFGDNMVLQQMQVVPVWGWDTPRTKVTVQFGGLSRSAVTDAGGRWEVDLRRLGMSREPRALVIKAGETVTFTNVLVGEVWLCSGQSNMEKPIGKQRGQKPTFNAEQELSAADYPQIRVCKVDRVLAATPQTELKNFSGWQACNSNNLNTLSFSAAAYFFGREIHTNLNVPVGLIESAWGGTRIEPWTPKEAMSAGTGSNSVSAAAGARLTNTMPATIYNAMIAPLVHFALRGALWYQGESNCMGPQKDNYTDQMAALVGGWRHAWGQGNFPFYYVQIAPFKYFSGQIKRVASADALPEFWEAQARAQSLPDTGMVVTTDLVDNLDDIHPRNKVEVGRRLARLALCKTYGRANIVCLGPTYRHIKIRGAEVTLFFDNTDGGLISKDGQPLTWFTMAGPDGKFVPAQAVIQNDTVVVTAPGVTEPIAVRFAWDETAQPNFFNQSGLPAVPFRTDGYGKDE